MSSTTNQYKIKSICRGSWTKELGEYDVITESGKDTVIKSPEGEVVYTTGISSPIVAVRAFLAYKFPFNNRPRLYQGKVVKFFDLGDSTDYTFAIVPTPEDSTVIIAGEERSSYTADKGTVFSWSVSKEGYETQNGNDYTLTSNYTKNVTLRQLVQFYAWSDNDSVYYTKSEVPSESQTIYTYNSYSNTMSPDTQWKYHSFAVVEDEEVLTLQSVSDDTQFMNLRRDTQDNKEVPEGE